MRIKTRLFSILTVLGLSFSLVSATLAAVRSSSPTTPRDQLAILERDVTAILQADLVMTKTVSSDPLACAASQSVQVVPGAEVRYCYSVLNSGTTTLTTHTLEDTQFGTLLSSQSITIPPSTSYIFSQTTVITQGVVNTATWTASDGLGGLGVFTDSASVDVQNPGLVLTKTASTAASCPGNQTLNVLPGTTVRYCYELLNNGPLTVTSHTLVDDQLGTLFADLAVSIGVGDTFVFSTTAQVGTGVTNQATWTGEDPYGNTGNSSDSMTVDIIDPIILLDKTASNLGTCPGSDSEQVIPGQDITYCFLVTNTGLVTLTAHTLFDDHLGLLLDDVPILLPPAGSYTYSQTQTITKSATNTATWTAFDNFLNAAIYTDTASVSIIEPTIEFTKTVSAVSGTCANTSNVEVLPGSDVTYCYELRNTGAVTLTNHTLEDDQLGTLLADLSVVVAPGAGYIYSTTINITEPITNVATWTASDPFENTTAAVDSAIVLLIPPSIDFQKTVSDNAGICDTNTAITVPPGHTVRYCYQIENTGVTTLTSHTLVDDQLGTLLDEEPITIGPGESYVYSTTAQIEEEVTNLATWTAKDTGDSSIQAQDSVTVSVYDPQILLEKTISTDATCPGIKNLEVIPGTEISYCFMVTNTGFVTLTNHSLSDSHLGLLLNNFSMTLPPSATFVVSQTEVALTSITNLATWTAVDEYSNIALDTDSATLTVPESTIALTKTVSAVSGVCADTQLISVDPGTDVTYCFTATNTGPVTLTTHTLTDDHLGTLLTSYPIELGPGETTVFSKTVTITESVVNNATWIALDSFGAQAEANDSASVTLASADIDLNPGEVMVPLPLSGSTEVTLNLSNQGTKVLNWSIEENLVTSRSADTKSLDSDRFLGERLFRRNVGLILANETLLGVEYANGSIWVTAGGVTSDFNEPNMLYQLDSSGTLQNVYTATTTTLFGWRDLAFDGTFLYASEDTGFIDQINPANGEKTGTRISLFQTGLNVARALTYDPDTDHFWVSDFSKNTIYELDRNGIVVTSFPNPTGFIYGFAWDDVSYGGPFLWAWTTDSPPRAVRIDPETGAYTGVSFTGLTNVAGVGGGATITSDLIPDTLVFLGLHQADSDTIVGYDLDAHTCEFAPQANPWLVVSPLNGALSPGSEIELLLSLNSTDLERTDHTGQLCITSNDPDEPLLTVPVVMQSFDVYLPIQSR